MRASKAAFWIRPPFGLEDIWPNKFWSAPGVFTHKHLLDTCCHTKAQRTVVKFSVLLLLMNKVKSSKFQHKPCFVSESTGYKAVDPVQLVQASDQKIRRASALFSSRSRSKSTPESSKANHLVLNACTEMTLSAIRDQ